MQKHYCAIDGQIMEADAHLDPLETEAQGVPVYLLPAGATFVRQDAEALAAEQLAAIEAARPLPPPEPTIADLQAAALAQVRTLRTGFLNVLDGLQSSALATGNAELATQLETAKQGARDITKVDVSTCKTAGDIANAYKTAWATVAAGAPDSVKRLYAEALL